MSLNRCFLGWVIPVLLAGCTAAEPPRAPTAPEPPSVAPAPEGMERGEGAESAPAGRSEASPTVAASPAPAAMVAPPVAPGASDLARSASREHAPSARPGLGTEWGEARVSHVRDVEFTRAGSAPFAMAALRYDDRAGVEALAARHGQASWREGGPLVTARGAMDVSVRNEAESPLEMWSAGGEAYVVGEAGERYTIVLNNRTSHRFEVVVTVDGLDVIDGKPGKVSKRGYFIGPYATFEIEGFRQNEDRVAAFRFGRVGDSYAARTGSARDVGVIGAAVFAERGDRFADDEEARLRDTATPFPGESRYARPPSR